MKLLDKPLHSLTAADLMSREVLTIPVGLSLRGAAQLLMRAHVSGAPVVDEARRCVGVISAIDFLKVAGEAMHGPLDEHVSCDWQVFDLDEVPEGRVQEYMTPDPVTVTRDVLLGDLARQMVDVHIHRVIVVDELDQPVGIVSSTDVLAAVAHYTSLEAAV
jgi:CBS-domain-containing membrane protein